MTGEVEENKKLFLVCIWKERKTVILQLQS